MLGNLDVSGVEGESLLEGSALGRSIGAEPVPGRGLNQRRYRVTAGHIGGQRVVGIGGVQHGRLLKPAHGLFKLLLFEELACFKEQLDRTAAIAAAWRRGRFCAFVRRAGRRGGLAGWRVGSRQGLRGRGLAGREGVCRLGLARGGEDGQQESGGEEVRPSMRRGVPGSDGLRRGRFHSAVRVRASRSASEVAQTSG